MSLQPAPPLHLGGMVEQYGLPFPSGGSAPSSSSLSAGGGASIETCTSIVHSLMCHRQGGESEQFAKRAVGMYI